MASIRKRKNGSYQIIVSGGYDSKGRQIRWYETYTPEEGASDTKIKKELKYRMASFESKCLTGKVSSNGKIKLSDYIPVYLENKKGVLSPTVHEKYNRIIKICIEPMLGHMKLKDIKPVHIQMFINKLKNRDTHFDGKPGKLSSATIKRYVTILQSIMHSAYKLQLIDSNPAESDKISLPPTNEPEIEILSDKELEELLFALEEEPLQYQALIHLALTTSCRRGELLGLKWNDIDMDTGCVTISKSVYKLTSDSQIKTKSTKTGKNRMVMIPEYCIGLLKRYQVQQDAYRLSIGDYWKGENWIFTQSDGKPMYPSTPTQWFSKFLQRHHLPHRKFHALRHTSATLLLTNGINIKNVAERLGHSQLKTTNRYVHAISKEEIVAANTFEKRFRKEKTA